MGVVIIVLAYPVWFTFAGPMHINGSPHTVAYWGNALPVDLLSLINQGRPDSFNSITIGIVVFLGWPLVATLACFAWFFRHRRAILFAGALALICFVLSLGPHLWLNGRYTGFPLPALVFERLPALDGFQMGRFALMTAVFVAGMFALGLEELWKRLKMTRGLTNLPQGWGMVIRTAIVGIVVTAVAIPLIPHQTRLTQTTDVPAFFTSKEMNSIPAGSVVLAYPYPDAASSSIWFGLPRVMLYQAVTGMRFDLIGGYGYFPSPTGQGGTTGPSTLKPESVQTLFDVALTGTETPSQRQKLSGRNLTNDLREILRRNGVDTVLVLHLPSVIQPGRLAFHPPSAIIDRLTLALGPPIDSGGVTAWFHVAQRLASENH